MEFFDRTREDLGEPLWTWTQAFMWSWTGQQLSVGEEGAGPYPEPEQLRLLSFLEVACGVRGLFFFQQDVFRLQPDISAEVALTSAEIGAVADHLAAGQATYHLASSDSGIVATAFSHNGSAVVAATLLRPGYQHWIDEGVVTDVTIDVPWSGNSTPQAVLVATPDVVECSVSPGAAPGTVRVTVPRFEIAGFILVSSDEAEIDRLREAVAGIPDRLRRLIVPAVAVQVEQTQVVLRTAGIPEAYRSPLALAPIRALDRCADAADARDAASAVRHWREAFRLARVAVDSAMRHARTHAFQTTPIERPFLRTPHGLHNIRGLAQAPNAEDKWHVVREFLVTGPFPLDRNEEVHLALPPGLRPRLRARDGRRPRHGVSRPSTARATGATFPRT